jgi:NADH-quinone oxidoreductase subunit N
MSADLTIILPEISLAVYAMAALIFAVYTTKDGMAGTLIWSTAAVFIAMAIWIGLSGGASRDAFDGMFVDDAFSRFAKVTILLSASAILVMSQRYMVERDLLRFEYPILIALAVVGMMVMVSAGDLMALYLGLELQSLSLYVVAALRRDSVKSTEAGLKYFVLGALSSGLLLYGASLTYGFTGTTQFDGIISVVSTGEISIGLLFGLVFMCAGLAFKVSAAPFHMWTPDVYEGSPTPITAFFATAPKVAAMGLFARVVHDAFGGALDVLGCCGRDRSTRYQTSDGLFVDCPHGVRVGWIVVWYCAGRRVDADVYGDLCDHEYRDIRVHFVDGTRWPSCDRHRRVEHAV